MPNINAIGIGNGMGGGIATPYTSFAGLKGDWDAALGTYSDAGVTPTTAEVEIPWWADQSGNGFHLKQAGAGLIPGRRNNVINGNPVIRGDGINDLLVATGFGTNWGSTVATMICVFSPAGEQLPTDGQYGLLHFSFSVGTYTRYPNDTAGYFGPFRNTRIEQTPSTMPVTGNHILTVISGASTYNIYLDGALVGTAASDFGLSTNLTTFFEPAPGYGALDIARLSFFNTAFTTAQRNAAHRQLGTKYAITVA